MANQAKGAGYERQDIYKNTRFKFLGIDNIHVVRDSHRKLYEQCHPFNLNEGNNQVPFPTPRSSHLPTKAHTALITFH